MEPAPIKKLPEEAINKIAAGEVILRPVNALKELVENALDAGSRQISVVVKDGGLKLLQITDDGCGIRPEDLPIVCERFSTSKIDTLSDLRSLGTFGFRGEALASISYVSHLSITTLASKSNDGEHTGAAHFCRYNDGKLEGNPQLIAGRKGTTITCEDLFYNMVARRKAIGTPAAEYVKILELVQKFAIHNSSVGFSCHKLGSLSADLSTLGFREQKSFPDDQVSVR